MLPKFLPSDEDLATSMGILPFWQEIAPTILSAGHIFWYFFGAFFLLLELVLPGISMSWIGFAAISTGMFVKLGSVYGWADLSFGEQAAFFLLFAVVAVALWARFGRPVIRNVATDL